MGAHHSSPGRLRLSLALVRLAGALVPRYERRDWRREWNAELVSYGRRTGVMRHALGALRHALWLRSQEWKADMLLQDLRYAGRSLARSKGFTAVALLTLGVGIGANIVVFGMFNSVLLRPYPFRDAGRIVSVYNTDRTDPGEELALSYPDYVDIRAANEVFEDIGVWDWEPVNMKTSAETSFVGAGRVTSGLFAALGSEPILGRTFRAEEDMPGQGDVVVLSEGLWRNAFGADADVLGETLVLDGLPYTVIGVWPQESSFPDEVALWIPLALDEGSSPRSNHWLGGLARLKPGITTRQAEAALAPLAARLEQEHPNTNRDRGLGLMSLRELRTFGIRPFFFLLLGTVGFLMLIVCANIANLLLARASSREREMSVRLALGASRLRLVRQLLTESVLLGAGGLLVGFVVSRALQSAVLGLIPLELPAWLVIEIDARDVGFMVGVAAIAVFVFGLLPALQLSRSSLQASLKDAPGGGGRRRHSRSTMRSALVVAEVAISLTLLIGAGLMARSLARIATIDPGFSGEGRLMATLQMPRTKYAEPHGRALFAHEILERGAALPGVEEVGIVSRFPLRGGSNYTRFMVEGQSEEDMTSNPSVLNNSGSPDYFDAMGIGLQRGRAFNAADSADAQPVAIVNDALAARYWPDGDALGKRLRTSTSPQWREIVGVVDGVHHSGLERNPDLQLYIPYEQEPTTRLSLVVHAAGDLAGLAPLLRETVRDIDPDQALYDLMPVERAVAESIWQWRFFSELMAVFGAVAVLIAAIGVYGVCAYAVAQRTREIGVRMALGAGRRTILRMVARQAGFLVGLGIVIGLGAAWLQSLALGAVLYEISATDPFTFATAVGFMVAVGMLAAWLPARRATRLDPVRALRDE